MENKSSTSNRFVDTEVSAEESASSPKKPIRWSPPVEDRSSPMDVASLLFSSLKEDTKEPSGSSVHRGCNRPACNRYCSRRSRRARAAPFTIIPPNQWSYLRRTVLVQKVTTVPPPHDETYGDHTSPCDNSDDESVLSFLLSASSDEEDEDGSVDEEDSSDISRD